MPAEWWFVEPDGGIDPKHAPREEVLAHTAEMAALGWADGRGHDHEDLPIVKVWREGEEPVLFELRARIAWTAKRITPRQAP